MENSTIMKAINEARIWENSLLDLKVIDDKTAVAKNKVGIYHIYLITDTGEMIVKWVTDRVLTALIKYNE